MVLTLALSVSACSAVGPKNSCDIFQPFYLDGGSILSDADAEWILKYDEVGHELCGWEVIPVK